MISNRPERMFGSQADNPNSQANSGDEGKSSYDERLSHILEAATGEMARLGYANASMRAIAKASGVSLAGLYHYFDSKEKILFLIQFRAFSSLLNNLKEKLHGVSEPENQLCVMIRAHVGYFAQNMSALKVCSHELDLLSGDAYEETRKIRREYYELTRKIIDRVMDTHHTDASMDRHVATMSLFGTLNWLYRWYDPKRGPSAIIMAHQITTQFLHGLVHASSNAKEVPTRRIK